MSGVLPATGLIVPLQLMTIPTLSSKITLSLMKYSPSGINKIPPFFKSLNACLNALSHTMVSLYLSVKDW